jgi:hypothetical protein
MTQSAYDENAQETYLMSSNASNITKELSKALQEKTVK